MIDYHLQRKQLDFEKYVYDSKPTLNIEEGNPLSFKLSLYSRSIIKIILIHDHLGTNTHTFLLACECES